MADSKPSEAMATAAVLSAAQQPARWSNLAYANAIANINLSQQNAVSQQQAMNQLMTAVVGKAVNNIANTGPLQALAQRQVMVENTLAQQLRDLQAAIQAIQSAPKP